MISLAVMALPPEPLDDVLPAAALVVVAEVLSVDDLAPWPVDRKGPPDSAPDRPAQRVKLRVSRVLRGAAPAAAAMEITVRKPASAYALHPGAHGAFLLDASGAEPAILGRYGPDSYALAEIEAALQRGPSPLVRGGPP